MTLDKVPLNSEVDCTPGRANPCRDITAQCFLLTWGSPKSSPAVKFKSSEVRLVHPSGPGRHTGEKRPFGIFLRFFSNN